ncbi:acylneuraminate cytidylyltransferase [Lacisediminihabitans profunda]|uniref:N-acylneuraminate cytidylyltransferase n=1 Tax=Lacisediminihabitans profunda TaxID=2594790 RepID=A0A5C8UUI0_9MICO|nr:acylneuraminate cytidylyltransferase [Lacisediminihabitans profunda]TXN31296.1 acylneuraminate cytidylyltransferase [Lacisediminihabitans profunda]
MSVVAIIPARGGSKGVPAKNLARVGGVSLIVRAVSAARASRLIDRVVVSTDDPSIAAAARSAGATIVNRPPTLSTDLATSESALLHVLEQQGGTPDIVVFIQATSPFINTAELDEAIERVRSGVEDVVFSAAETHAFLWRITDAGAVGVNHEPAVRQRRQDREPQFRETGAFYVLRAAGFVRAGHRFFGRLGVTIVDERTAIEIDTVDELEMANALAPLVDPSLEPHPIDVDAVVTDFDGVHTDDRVLIGADGSEFVTTNRSDGLGVRLLRESGMPVLILSTEAHPVVSARAAKLRVEVLQGVRDKAAALTGWAEDRGIPLERIAYLGNDVNDLGCLAIVGWPIAVPDAMPEVIAAARVVLDTPGGYGAVRELADLILTTRSARIDEQLEEPWLYPSAVQS